MILSASKVAIDGGPVGQFVQQLEGLKVGDELVIPGLFPGLPMETLLRIESVLPPDAVSGGRQFSTISVVVECAEVRMGLAKFNVCGAGYVLQAEYEEGA